MSTKSCQVEPNVVVYSSLASQGAWCGCLETMRQQSVEPNVVSLTAAARWPSLLELLHSKRATVVTQNRALEAFASSLRWPQALQLLLDMPRVRMAASAMSFTAGLRGCEANQWRLAVRLLLLMRHSDLRFNVYSGSPERLEPGLASRSRWVQVSGQEVGQNAGLSKSLRRFRAMLGLLVFSCLLSLSLSDQSENCVSWAAAGECGRNPAYMLKATFCWQI